MRTCRPSALAATVTLLVVGCAEPASPAALATDVDAARYEAEVRALARVRDHGSVAWQETQDHCADALAAAGFEVERHDYGGGVNVIGTLPGRRPERLVLGAHYDAVPGCTGADDNASGLAGVLEVARVLGRGQYERTLVVACWDDEESYLVGSRAYLAREAESDAPIVGGMALEMIGYRASVPYSQRFPEGYDLLFPDARDALEARAFRGDFIALVADEASAPMRDAFAAHADAIDLPVIALTVPDDALFIEFTGRLRASDHGSFWSHGVPALMLSDTAEQRNAHYHCIEGEDSPDDLDYAFASSVVRAAVGAMARELGLRGMR